MMQGFNYEILHIVDLFYDRIS